MTRMILSVNGSDRPGLTQALSAAVLSAGGNWLESHLSRLGGLYVGSVLIELEEGRVDALRSEVAKVDSHGLQVRIAPAVEAASKDGETMSLELVGQDRPGIVHRVTAVLAGMDVNIEAFSSSIGAEPYSGAPLFRMEARLRLPSGVTPGQVQAALEAISAEVMVDITIGPVAVG